MTLRSCGTVVSKESDRVIVRIERERCANCTGCIRFNLPKKVSAIGTQAIGERVAIRTSAAQLALASLLVFGFPVVTLSLVTLIWTSIWMVVIALPLSFLIVYLVMHYARLRDFLKVYAESI